MGYIKVFAKWQWQTQQRRPSDHIEDRITEYKRVTVDLFLFIFFCSLKNIKLIRKYKIIISLYKASRYN